MFYYLGYFLEYVFVKFCVVNVKIILSIKKEYNKIICRKFGKG